MTPQQILPRFSQEFRATLKLALPLAAAQLAQMGMGITDTVMVGALGRDALAAGGLAAASFFSITAVLQGGLIGVGILIAHARGADDLARISPVLRSGAVLALLITACIVPVFWFAEPLLLAIGEPEMIARDVGAYIRILVLCTPATMWLAMQRSTLAAMSHTRPVMMIGIGALFMNGVLNYALIHGAWGFPEMGLMGSATASAITIWAMSLAMAAAIGRIPELRGHTARAHVEWGVVRELVHLGWPIAITFGVEILLFLMAALLIGTLGATAMAAHNVTINAASLTFMVPLAIGQAANIRVGFHLGAKSPRAAQRAAIVALELGVVFMTMTAIIMFTLPREIALLFNLNPARPADVDVIAMVVQLLTIAAWFQVFDGAQCIAAGALRGFKDTRVPMVMASVGYWAIGFPVAWALGFPLNLGAAGIWWGLALGLAMAAVFLGARLWRVSTKAIAERGVQ
ncbi:MAG: MATE family efflux transporter [Rhodospirillaceae bacterium]|nr:MATE family efflux transporter [Rhodospirillaceae bacterium]